LLSDGGSVQSARVERTIDGGVVMATVMLPNTDDVVVLLDPDHRPDGVLPWHPFNNVLRVSPSGQIVWRAELLSAETTAKCWHGVEFEGGLRARTYSYECMLDSETGRIVDSTFMK